MAGNAFAFVANAVVGFRVAPSTRRASVLSSYGPHVIVAEDRITAEAGIDGMTHVVKLVAPLKVTWLVVCLLAIDMVHLWESRWIRQEGIGYQPVNQKALAAGFTAVVEEHA